MKLKKIVKIALLILIFIMIGITTVSAAFPPKNAKIVNTTEASISKSNTFDEIVIRIIPIGSLIILGIAMIIIIIIMIKRKDKIDKDDRKKREYV